MPTRTKIEWTEVTWNAVTGCSKVSSGCCNCYAERFARRLQRMGVRRYKDGFSVTCHWDLLAEPLKWKKPARVFVNSMSDLFHEEVSTDFIIQMFDTMSNCSHHQFQILTKRSKRLLELSSILPWPENIWIGVTVESRQYVSRIRDLQKVPASIRFVSFEPLIECIDRFPLRGLHWVIVGGESGPGARPLSPDWARRIRDRVRRAEIPFFFKQWGGPIKKRNGRVLDGKVYEEYPRAVFAKQIEMISDL